MDAPGSDSMPPSREPGARSPRSGDYFLHLLLLFEAALALAGVAIGWGTGIDWRPMIRWEPAAAGMGLLGGLVLFGLHVLLLLPGGPRNPLYRLIVQPLYAAVSGWASRLSFAAILLLAASSGLAEELFFRGWLQTQFGLVPASVAFGLCHIWGKDAVPYGLYAVGMGVLLGLLFEQTGSNLWAPILAHSLNNLLGFLALKHRWLPVPR